MVTLGANPGGANPQPASWEAAGGEAAAEMALPGQPEPLAGKEPFQIPPPLLGEAADFAGEKLPQWQVCAQLRGQAPDQGTMSIPPMTAELFKVLEIKVASTVPHDGSLEARSHAMLATWVKTAGASICQLLDRAMSGRLAKTEQPDDPEYVYSPYISVLREWL
jgi:hypothetical protein